MPATRRATRSCRSPGNARFISIRQVVHTAMLRHRRAASAAAAYTAALANLLVNLL